MLMGEMLKSKKKLFTDFAFINLALSFYIAYCTLYLITQKFLDREVDVIKDVID